MTLRELLNKMKSLNKSTAARAVADNLYKQKEGYVSSVPKQEVPHIETSKVPTFKKIETKMAKPMHMKGLPMMNRSGNSTVSERTADGKPSKPVL